MIKIALLVVDVQHFLIKNHPYNEKNTIENIKRLIETARKNDVEVIYVRHEAGAGSPFERNTKGWEIYHEVQPNNNEIIIDKKFNNAFLKTELQIYLKSKGIENIILVGLQTEFCIDSTCKAAFELDYKVVIPEETNTTFGNVYINGENLYKHYNYKIWNNRFGKVIPMTEVEEMIINAYKS